MWRYLKAAFWGRVSVPLLGALPVNAMAAAAVTVLGLLHPAVWLVGLGLETAYLFLTATHERFQKTVDASDLQERREALGPERATNGRDLQRLVDELEAGERQQLYALKNKLGKIVSLYEQFQVDSYSLEHNRASLSALLGHYARLLAARSSIVRHWSADPQQLRAELNAVEAELGQTGMSAELRTSRLQTLEILRVRLLNQEKKETVLAEIDSERQRIEQQFDLALENAAIGSQPLSVSADTLYDPGQLGGSFDPLRDLPEAEVPPTRQPARRRNRVSA
jgi:hypothetical protein